MTKLKCPCNCAAIEILCDAASDAVRGWEDGREPLGSEVHSGLGGRGAELPYASGKVLDVARGYDVDSMGGSAYSVCWGLEARSEVEGRDELDKTCGELSTMVKYCGSGGWWNDKEEVL